jgi:hypothetical protein
LGDLSHIELLLAVSVLAVSAWESPHTLTHSFLTADFSLPTWKFGLPSDSWLWGLDFGGDDFGLSFKPGIARPGVNLEFLGDLELLRQNSLSELFDFSLCGDFFDFFVFPERSNCSDLDFGIAEEMQSASMSSSSGLVLLRESIERELREELKDLSLFCGAS